MKNIVVILISLSTIGCGENAKKSFSLVGVTHGIKDGSLVFLKHDGIILDSANIKNNTFEFNTNLPFAPIKLWLHDKDFSHYRAFWADDNPMTFDATKTDFIDAEITGSKEENLSFLLHQKTDTLSRGRRQKLEIEFIRNHPESIVSASLLATYSKAWGKEKTKNLYELLSENNKHSKYGQEIKTYLELNKNPQIGDNFINIEAQGPDGTKKKLSDLKGDAILLEFWASWCRPCRKENPSLVKTYLNYKRKGFQIFAVSLDSNKEKWLEAIKEDRLNWTHVTDLKGDRNEASLIYGVEGIPDNFLIDKNGIIVGRNLRGEQLNQALEKLL